MIRTGLIVVLLAVPVVAARGADDDAREAHGVGDAYAEPGVAIAWAVLRGPTDAGANVVVRVRADPAPYIMIAARGTNPFSQQQQSLLGTTPLAGSVELRAPRAQFAEFPRTELRFYASTAAAQADAPARIVFYLGVPDTTPEFLDEAKMEAYLADRLARLSITRGGKAP